MNIDFSKMVTAAEKLVNEGRLEMETALAARRSAYISESDPLRLEADYDALSQGREPDYAAWLASVAAIKARYPLPATVEPVAD